MAFIESDLPIGELKEESTLEDSKEVAIIAVFLQILNFDANDIFGAADISKRTISSYIGMVKFNEHDDTYKIVQYNPSTFDPTNVVDICKEIANMYPSYTDRSRVSCFLKPALVKEHLTKTWLVSALGVAHNANQQLESFLDHHNAEFKAKYGS